MALLGQGTRKPSWQRSFIRHFSTEHLHKAQVVHPKLSVPFVKNRREAVLNASYDAIVIGGGHNGLTAAAYLAKAKKKVLVLERRHVIGGAAVTEEMVPGFYFSRASYCLSLLRPVVMKELDLQRHGLEIITRNPSTFSPLLDGRYLMLGPDMESNKREIAKFSEKDAEAYPLYEEMLDKLFHSFDPLLDLPPYDPQSESSFFDQLPTAKQALQGLFKLGKDIPNLIEVMTAPATRILQRWFESEPLLNKLATDAVTGAMMGPSTPGSGSVLFHHTMGDIGAGRGTWAYVKGGMGAVSAAIARAANEAGAQIITEAAVERVLVNRKDCTAEGIILKDGTEIKSKIVLSNCDPHTTYNKLIGQEDLVECFPEEFLKSLKSYDYSSATFKINLAVDRLPNFTCIPHTDNKPGPQHFGTIHFLENIEQLDRAFVDALSGIPSNRPFIEMTIPSSLDNSLSPPGQHVVQLFTQYAPYHLKNGKSWDDSATKEEYAKSCYNVIEQYCPGFTKSIIGADLLSPVDLERQLGLTGGNIFHGSMALDQLFCLRPVPGYSRYKAPLRNYFLCGSGAHPGGGVMGAPGRNCALLALKESLK